MAFLEQESSPFALTFFWKIHSRNNKLIQEMSRFRIGETTHTYPSMSHELTGIFQVSFYLSDLSLVSTCFNGMLRKLAGPFLTFPPSTYVFYLSWSFIPSFPSFLSKPWGDDKKLAAKKAAKAKLEVEPVEVNVSWDVPRPVKGYGLR